MWSVRLVGALMAAILYSCAAQDHDDWIKAVENEDDLGKTELTFTCSEYPAHPRPTINDDVEYEPYNRSRDFPEAWMLPNLTILDDTGPIGGGKIVITDDHQNMTIYNVTKEDFGVYHCMVMINETEAWYLVKWGVNMRGPYFEDLWKKYQTNTIIAFSASGGFTALMIIICVVYQYRWQPPGEEDSSSVKEKDAITGNNIHVEDGKINQAFDDYEEPTTSKASEVYNVSDKPPLPGDGIKADTTVTYSTLTPVETVENREVEEDTRF